METSKGGSPGCARLPMLLLFLLGGVLLCGPGEAGVGAESIRSPPTHISLWDSFAGGIVVMHCPLMVRGQQYSNRENKILQALVL